MFPLSMEKGKNITQNLKATYNCLTSQINNWFGGLYIINRHILYDHEEKDQYIKCPRSATRRRVSQMLAIENTMN